MIMKDSSFSMVSIKDMLRKCCRFLRALAIEGATLTLIQKLSRQYLRPWPVLPELCASYSFLNGMK